VFKIYKLVYNIKNKQVYHISLAVQDKIMLSTDNKSQTKHPSKHDKKFSQFLVLLYDSMNKFVTVIHTDGLAQWIAHLTLKSVSHEFEPHQKLPLFL